MSTIAGITYDSWKGALSGPRRPLQVITRAGVEGVGVIQDAPIGKPCTVVTKHFSVTAAASETLKRLAESKQATWITLTDPSQATWTNVLVVEVQITQTVLTRVNGAPRWMNEIQWILRPEGVPGAP